jgi:hypothetical protein
MADRIDVSGTPHAARTFVQPSALEDKLGLVKIAQVVLTDATGAPFAVAALSEETARKLATSILDVFR